MAAGWPGVAEAPWAGRVRAALLRWRQAGLGPNLVVAVSGGGDSVALLRLLHAAAPELGLVLSVAHLHHTVRGAASDADAAFVAGLAGRLGLPCDLGRWAPSRAGHFEADARRARYAFLRDVARARGAAAVAVAHTRDDQAETILHRILRGTGPRGLAGMPGRRPLDAGITLIRPFLQVTRGDLRAFLAALGQEFRDDATNADLTRTRARIRHDLLPRLAAEFNPRVADALVRLGRLSGAAQRALDREVADLARAATIAAGPDRLVLDRGVLGEVSPSLRAEVVRRVWRRAHWPEGRMNLRRWRRLAHLAAAPHPPRATVAGIDAEASGRLLQLSRRKPSDPEPPPRSPIRLPVPGTARFPGGCVLASLDADGPCDETIDLDQVVLPLEVGWPRPGDRFAPLGMGGRSMSLNDFFRGRGVPRLARAGTPLVRDAAGIIWVVGHRIAHRVRRTPTSCRTLGLRWLGG